VPAAYSEIQAEITVSAEAVKIFIYITKTDRDVDEILFLLEKTITDARCRVQAKINVTRRVPINRSVMVK